MGVQEKGQHPRKSVFPPMETVVPWEIVTLRITAILPQKKSIIF